MIATAPSHAAEEAKDSLDEAIENVELAINASKGVGEVKYLPKALYGVELHLPIARDLLTRMVKLIEESESGGAVQRDNAFYLKVKTSAEKVSAQADRIGTIYSQTLSNEDGPPTERYRLVVGSGGEKLETVMEGLLRNISSLARKFSLGKDDREKITEALGEVKKIPVSISEEGAGAGMKNVNSGSGVMPIHNGNGDINTTTGNGGVNLPGGTITNFNQTPQTDGS